MSLVNKILTAAMNSDQHVFVNYSPHVNWLEVRAVDSKTDYSDHGYPYLLEDTVYLDSKDTDERLAELLEKVEGL